MTQVLAVAKSFGLDPAKLVPRSASRGADNHGQRDTGSLTAPAKP